MSTLKPVFLIICSIISETQQKAGEKQIWIDLGGRVGDGEGVKVHSQDKSGFKGEE